MCIGLSTDYASASSTALINPNLIPKDIVLLSSIDPSIIIDLRYASKENFLGRIVPGYQHAQAYCTLATAQALQKVQAHLKQQGYQLVVYDAYRPQHTVDAFIAWAQDPKDDLAKALYYPTISKPSIFQDEYLMAKSGHSRGSTVDVSILPLHQKINTIRVESRALSDGETIPYLNDNSVDMGSSFDLFHPVSHHGTHLITPQQSAMRTLLRNVMEEYHFETVPTEWWHYTLKDEPYPDTYFDFSIEK
ncbi:MAG: M15 family metallopeptidase [Legionellaceae bacterium]|nr:M15 family metallopeptidase [Legionellaceae bacterium]